MNGQSRSRAPRGGAMLWTLLIIAVVGAVALLAWLGAGRGASNASPDVEAAGAAPLDDAAAAAELQRLRARISAVIEAQGEPAKVLPDVRRYVQRYPKLAAGRTALAQVLMFAERWEDALQEFERSLELDPRQPEVHLFAGSISRQLGRLEDAQRHYSQAVGLERDNGRYRLFLARVYLDQSRYDEARQTLLEALRLDSSLHEAYAAMADLYARQGKLDMALVQIDRAIEHTPEADRTRHRPTYLRQRATLLRRANQPADALATLRRLPPKMLIEPAVCRELAACWAMLGEPQKAAWHYEEVLIVDPARADAAAEAAAWYLKAGMPTEARRNVDHLRSLNPRHERLPQLRDQLSRASG